MARICIDDLRELGDGRYVIVHGLTNQNNLKVALCKDGSVLETYENVDAYTFNNYDFSMSPVISRDAITLKSKIQSIENITITFGDGCNAVVIGSNREKGKRTLTYDLRFSNGLILKNISIKDIESDLCFLYSRLVKFINDFTMPFGEYNVIGYKFIYKVGGVSYKYTIEGFETVKRKTMIYLAYEDIHMKVDLSSIWEDITPVGVLSKAENAYKKYRDGYCIACIDIKPDESTLSCIDSDGFLYIDLTLEQFIACTRMDFHSLSSLCVSKNVVTFTDKLPKTVFNRLVKYVAHSGGRWYMKHGKIAEYIKYPEEGVIPKSMCFGDGSAFVEDTFGDIPAMWDDTEVAVKYVIAIKKGAIRSKKREASKAESDSGSVSKVGVDGSESSSEVIDSGVSDSEVSDSGVSGSEVNDSGVSASEVSGEVITEDVSSATEDTKDNGTEPSDSVEDECPFDEDVKPSVKAGGGISSETKDDEKFDAYNLDAKIVERQEKTVIDMSVFFNTAKTEVADTKKEEKAKYSELRLGSYYVHEKYGKLRIVQSPDSEGLVTGVDSENNPHMGLSIASFS